MSKQMTDHRFNEIKKHLKELRIVVHFSPELALRNGLGLGLGFAQELIDEVDRLKEVNKELERLHYSVDD